MRRSSALAASSALAMGMVGSGCPGDRTAETGLIPDQGCVVDPGHFVDVSIEPTLVPTVFDVAWTTAEPAVGHVLFTAGDALWNTTPDAQAELQHQALLVGSPALATVQVRLISQVDEELVCSDTFTRSTPAPPPELPVLTVNGDYAMSEPDGWALAPVGFDKVSIPALVDSQGRYCWWWQDEGYYFYADLARGGRSMLLLDSRYGLEVSGRLLEVGLDGTILDEREVPGPTTTWSRIPTV